MQEQSAVSITTDQSNINLPYVHHYLNSQSYWAKGISQELVQRAIAGSLCFVVLKGERQIGFARIISDYATFAYLADVFIDPQERGQGYSKLLMQSILAHPQLQGLRRWLLMTKDAHGLYSQFGFTPLGTPQNAMEIAQPHIYTKKQEAQP